MAGRVELKLFAGGGSTLDPTRFGPDGLVGPDKVAVRYVYALLTPAGSVPGRPDDGTDFLAAVRDFRSEFDVFAAFAAAEPRATAQVRAAEAAADPADEKIGWVGLAGLAMTGDTLTLTLVVSAADGARPADPVEFTVTP